MDSTHADDQVSPALLETFTDAFNNHDVDALMACMTEDCVFEGAGGPEVYGVRFQGRDAVAAAFAKVWADMPDAHWGEGNHFVLGQRGVSEWTFTGTQADGSRIHAQGCDLFTFRDGKIHLKQAFRKNRPLLAPQK